MIRSARHWLCQLELAPPCLDIAIVGGLHVIHLSAYAAYRVEDIYGVTPLTHEVCS